MSELTLHWSDQVLLPGDRVKVFDPLLYKDDVSTPLSRTMRPATIVKRYGLSRDYPDLLDVEFDHRPGVISRAHFTGATTKTIGGGS